MSFTLPGSGQYLNVPCDYPVGGGTFANLTVGFWVYPTITDRPLWTFSDATNAADTSTSNEIGCYVSTLGTLVFFTQAVGGAVGNTNTASGLSTASWFFCLCRVGPGGGLYWDCYNPATQSITQVSLAGPAQAWTNALANLTIGTERSRYYPTAIQGFMEEFFLCKRDIFNSDASSPTEKVKLLAHRGPFSLRTYTPDLYLPMKNFLPPYGAGGEAYNLGKSLGDITRFNTTAVLSGPGCPYLSGDYVRSTDLTRPSLV